MNSIQTVENEIIISAPTHKVWDALVNPEMTKKYMFGCETISDWKVGSSLLWQAMWEGKETVFVSGRIVGIEPGQFLAYTTFDPFSAYEDIPENHLTVTYTVSSMDGATKLVVTQGDYSKVPEGEKRYNDAMAAGGWQTIIEQIKDLVEAN